MTSGFYSRYLYGNSGVIIDDAFMCRFWYRLRSALSKKMDMNTTTKNRYSFIRWILIKQSPIGRCEERRSRWVCVFHAMLVCRRYVYAIVVYYWQPGISELFQQRNGAETSTGYSVNENVWMKGLILISRLQLFNIRMKARQNYKVSLLFKKYSAYGNLDTLLNLSELRCVSYRLTWRSAYSLLTPASSPQLK